MARQVLFGEEAIKKILAGAKTLHDAVSTTLGPRGRNVGVDLGYDAVIWHDGVSVAQQIELEDAGENFAVRVLRQTANKQVSTVGDGTTVSIVLAYAILKEAYKVISAGTNAMSLRKGLEEARDLLIEELKKQAIPIKTAQQAVDVAIISSEDLELGKQIGELIFKLGIEGVVTVEESKGPDTTIEQQEGMQFDQGYFSPYFMTDPVRAEATAENARIFLTDKPITNIQELLPLLDGQFLKAGLRDIVFVAADFSDNVLASLIVNKARGTFNVLCVKAPYYGQLQKDFLQDIAALTGSTVITQDQGMKFENTTLDMLGMAKRVTSTKDSTLIVGTEESKALTAERVESIKAEMERDEAVSEYQREKLRERVAKLTNGIAVINVGGATEIEIKEKLERAKDAVAATQAALKEGIVPGGEVIYLNLLKSWTGDPATYKGSERILYDALKKPFYKLAEHAGYEGAKYEAQLKGNDGLDVTDGQVKDMIKAGIIDPAMVAREAITNAVSTAIQLMTTEALILPIKEEKKNA